MVYDWEGKEDICYRMYIDEKRSLEDIMEYMKVDHSFAPRYVLLFLRFSPLRCGCVLFTMPMTRAVGLERVVALLE